MGVLEWRDRKVFAESMQKRADSVPLSVLRCPVRQHEDEWFYLVDRGELAGGWGTGRWSTICRSIKTKDDRFAKWMSIFKKNICMQWECFKTFKTHTVVVVSFIARYTTLCVCVCACVAPPSASPSSPSSQCSLVFHLGSVAACRVRDTVGETVKSAAQWLPTDAPNSL